MFELTGFIKSKINVNRNGLSFDQLLAYIPIGLGNRQYLLTDILSTLISNFSIKSNPEGTMFYSIESNYIPIPEPIINHDPYRIQSEPRIAFGSINQIPTMLNPYRTLNENRQSANVMQVRFDDESDLTMYPTITQMSFLFFDPANLNSFPPKMRKLHTKLQKWRKETHQLNEILGYIKDKNWDEIIGNMYFINTTLNKYKQLIEHLIEQNAPNDVIKLWYEFTNKTIEIQTIQTVNNLEIFKNDFHTIHATQYDYQIFL